MSQNTSGLKSILSLPVFYNLSQNLVGADKGRGIFTSEYIRGKVGDHILDIGCGTGEILDYLPDVKYYGFDINPVYIDSARKIYGGRGSFACAHVSDKILAELPKFDIALAIGVLHHLDDDEVIGLCELAKSALKPGGRLVTIDPCYVDGQSAIARLIIRCDRGQNVRTEAEYVRLCKSAFETIQSTVRHDMYRIPYSHVILECS